MDNPLEAGSPPPAELDEASRQLPALPTEILQRIIQLALPRLSFTTFRERYDVLLSCCRVNKLWAAIAQEELRRHVGLRRRTAAGSLLRGLEHARAISTHSVRLLITSRGSLRDDSNRLEVSQMESILRASPGLKVLHVVAKDEPQLVLDLGTLSKLAQGLQELTLDFCAFEPSSPHSLSLSSHLRRLTLSFMNGPKIVSILASADLPLLQELVLLVEADTIATSSLDTAFSRHGAQLTAFTLSFVFDDFVLPAEVWATFTALENLTMDHGSPREEILPLLPAPLRRLRLLSSFCPIVTSLCRLNSALQASPKSIETLEYLVVPKVEEFEEDEEDEYAEEHAARRSVAEFCLGRGIEMMERPPFEHEDCLEYLEDSIDAW